MNKDLDERIVPNGQYRHAENIQVSTSDGGEVGTIQNVLGNSLIANQDFISDQAVCIASIADEKNDKIYWFVKDVGSEVEFDSPISEIENPLNWHNPNDPAWFAAVHASSPVPKITIQTIGDGTSNSGAIGYPGYRTGDNNSVLQLIDGKKYEIKIQFGINDIGNAVYHTTGNPAPNKVFYGGIFPRNF